MINAAIKMDAEWGESGVISALLPTMVSLGGETNGKSLSIPPFALGKKKKKTHPVLQKSSDPVSTHNCGNK